MRKRVLCALFVCACGGTGDVRVDAAPDHGDVDASSAVDAGPSCSVGGIAGECKDVSLCTGDFTATPGHCPGPANIQCCTPSAAACTAADKPQPNVGLSEGAGLGGCPAGMLLVSATTPFCIDRYEASLVLADGTPWSPYFNPGTAPVRARSIAGAVPQGYINGVQAGNACAAAGKRLCTNTEWLRACRGPSTTTYPYGNTRQAGVCNDARAMHPAVEYFGSSAPSTFSMLDHPCINQLPDSLDRTGANTGCVTAEGAFDMMGNLHEWTSDTAGTFRGGYYVDTVMNGNGCLYVTTAHNTAHWDYSTGFRCCADAP